jgi:hypothetical protein
VRSSVFAQRLDPKVLGVLPRDLNPVENPELAANTNPKNASTQVAVQPV